MKIYFNNESPKGAPVSINSGASPGPKEFGFTPTQSIGVFDTNKIINKNLIKQRLSDISFLDRGFLYGDGVFETLRCYNGAPYALDKHLQRLNDSLNLLKIKLCLEQKEIETIIYSLLKQNKLKSKDTHIVRIMVSRGTALKRGLPFSFATEPTLIITMDKYAPPPDSLYNEGVKVVSIKTPHSRLPIKALSFLNNALAFNEAFSQGAYEGIFTDDNEIIEGSITNIVFLKGKKIFFMASSYALPGVTQDILAIIGKQNGYKIEKATIKLNEINLFDSCVLTNSLIEILPVKQFNDVNFKISDNVIELMNLYKTAIMEH